MFKLIGKMLRPQVAIVLLLFAAVGMAQGGYRQELVWQLPGIVVVILAWWLNATSINDLADYEIDKINLKGAAERPLANKKASKKQIIALYLVSAVVALVIGFLLDFRIGLLVAVCLALNYIYSTPPIRISYRGVLAPLLLPIGYVILPYFVGVWALKEQVTLDGWLILVAIYISFFGRILLKDFRDVKGDAKFGKLTFLLRYGRTATCITSALGLIVGSTILLFVIPHNALIIGALEILLACALFGLYRLHSAQAIKQELLIIGAIVKAASGVVFMLLALLLIRSNGGSLSQQILVSLVISLYFVAMFWDFLNRADKIYQKR